MTDIPGYNAQRAQRLKSAVCEYLDDGEIDALIDDLKTGLQEEMNHFTKQAGYYKTVLEIFTHTTKTTESENA